MTEEEDFADSLDFGVTLLEEDFALLLDFLSVLEQDEGQDPSLLLRMTLLDEDDDVVSSQSSHTDEEESSSCGAKLLSSSPHPARNTPRTIAMEIIRLHFVTLRMMPSFILSV